MDLSIIIVNWNVRELLRQTLLSIYKNPARKYSFEVIVVDNASADNSAAMVEKEFSQVTLIKSPKNVGFAAGNNLGIKIATGRFILCLNPDTEVQPETLDFIPSAFEKEPQLGALGVKLLNPDRTLQASCKSFPDLDTIIWNATSLDTIFPNSKIFGKYNMTWFKHDQEREVDQPMGAALAVRREVIQQVGIYDERYFMYFDEVDWCYRIKKAGWKIKFFPQVEIVHHWAQSTKQALFKMNKQWYISFYKYLCKNRKYPSWLVLLFLSSMVWFKIIVLLLLLTGLIGLIINIIQELLK
jgi:GT2 family glycosyltransferase